MAENENNVELEEQVELNKENKEKKVKEKSNKKKNHGNRYCNKKPHDRSSRILQIKD